MDLDELRLTETLTDGWHLSVASMEYLPQGGGSHHWVALDSAGTRRFVTVDDLDDKEWLGGTRDEVFSGLGRALDTASVLRHEVGLTFVVSPLPNPDGDLLLRFESRYSVSLFPFLEARSFAFGPYADPNLQDRALDLVIALHDATEAMMRRAPRHAPGYDAQDTLKAFLADPARPWDAGPFSQQAHDLLVEHDREIARLVDGYDRLVILTAPAREHVVITHGEPHPANLLSSDGELWLIDWDTTALAPPERDLALVVPEAEEGCARSSARRALASIARSSRSTDCAGTSMTSPAPRVY